MDAGLRLTSTAFAYGEIVWVRRPDAGVKFEGGQRCPRAMVSQKAGSPGRLRISRKAIAWGRPVCSPLNLYARGQHISLQHACETAGAARTRSSPRPLTSERANEMQNFGQIMPRGCEGMFRSINVIARSEATRQSILSSRGSMDCFASLAMTWRGWSELAPALILRSREAASRRMGHGPDGSRRRCAPPHHEGLPRQIPLDRRQEENRDIDRESDVPQD